MNKFICIALAVSLTGCASTTQMLTTKEQIVILPTASMYNCPSIKTYPNPEKLTDLQVAKVIVDLHTNNKICKNSLDAIKKFLEESKAQVETKK
jgi:uncharacterized protein YcfL